MTEYSKLEPYISPARIHSFKNACKGNHELTLQLYLAHIQLSQAFYPLLSSLEVSLRNALDQCCITYFKDSDWIQKEKNGAFRYQRHIADSIAKAESKVAPRITHNRLVAELMFGFWTDFFSKGVYKILKGAPYTIFTNLSKGTQRAQIYTTLNEVRLFRNRVYHNEPICFSNSNLDLTHARHIHAGIKEVLNWLEPDLLTWTSNLDTIGPAIQHMEQIILACKAV
jgi:hypothetical protein